MLYLAIIMSYHYKKGKHDLCTDMKSWSSDCHQVQIIPLDVARFSAV